MFALKCKSSSQYVILYATWSNVTPCICLIVDIAQGQKKGRHYEVNFGHNSLELSAHSGKSIINHV